MDLIKRDLIASKLANALNLSADTVGRYAKEGKIPFEKTPGGHRRFNLEEVKTALEASKSSSISGMRFPGELVFDPLAVGPDLPVSASARLRAKIRATRTVLLDDEVAEVSTGKGALDDLIKNARRILVSQ